MKIKEENLSKIRSRLQDFKALPEEEHFKEFMFCLLTPQSNAQRCWSAVEEISKLKKLNTENVTQILSTRTRFHHTKAKRIFNARETYDKIKPLLSSTDSLQTRNEIAKIVNGYGLKEASHFLRNIGKSNNQIAILDRHILRNLKKENIISDDKIKNARHYFEIEQAYLGYAKSIKISADELDLLWWSQENGEIFK